MQGNIRGKPFGEPYLRCSSIFFDIDREHVHDPAKRTLFSWVFKIGYVGGRGWVFLFVSPNPVWVSSHWQTVDAFEQPANR